MKNNQFISIYNLLTHPMKGKCVDYNGKEFVVNNVYKEWNSGWYISIELISDETKKKFIKIPYMNINSENLDILDRIKIVQEKVKVIENGSSRSE